MDKKPLFGPGNLLAMPFRALNLPFKKYREYYGTPKKEEEYQGTFLQKERVKKIIPLILRGKNIDKKDQKFMDMFNDFLTSEGHHPIDQTGVNMKCDDSNNCTQYFYKSSGTKRKKIVSEPESDEETKDNDVNKFNIYFYTDLLGMDKKKILFLKNGDYGLSFLGKDSSKGTNDFYFKTTRLPKDHFLIFKTKYKNPINRNAYYSVYQDNSVVHFREPFYLGDISAKIYTKK
jgi:hypothetical protein